MVAASLADHAVLRYQLRAWPLSGRVAQLCDRQARIIPSAVRFPLPRVEFGVRQSLLAPSHRLDGRRVILIADSIYCIELLFHSPDEDRQSCLAICPEYL